MIISTSMPRGRGHALQRVCRRGGAGQSRYHRSGPAPTGCGSPAGGPSGPMAATSIPVPGWCCSRRGSSSEHLPSLAERGSDATQRPAKPRQSRSAAAAHRRCRIHHERAQGQDLGPRPRPRGSLDLSPGARKARRSSPAAQRLAADLEAVEELRLELQTTIDALGTRVTVEHRSRLSLLQLWSCLHFADRRSSSRDQC